MKLLAANVGSLVSYPSSDVKVWSDIYKFLPMNASLVDRAGIVTMPFRFEPYKKFMLPVDLDGFAATYEDCCNRRVQELLELQDRQGVPIALFYSGGIDSTLVLISFAKILGAELRSRVKVFLSVDSIRENPSFYYRFVRKNCDIESSEKFPYLFDGSHIIVGAEHNDQLFGADVVNKIARFTSFEEVKRPYNREFVTGVFRLQGMQKLAANAWFDVISEHARRAPCPVETVFDLFWWLNFVFKWQSVYFRMVLRINKELHGNINQRFLDTFYNHFFSTVEFQKWAMVNTDLKIGDSWRSYKFQAKELIYEFNKDRDYLENKTKQGSLFRLFLERNMATALTTDYEFLSDLRPQELYNSANSFVGVSRKAPARVTSRRGARGPAAHLEAGGRP